MPFTEEEYALLYGRREGIDKWNDLRRTTARQGERPILAAANLSGADLSGAVLFGANLFGANLSGTGLIGANLFGADLSGANLFGANLKGAVLNGVNLRGAWLFKADLSGADLSGADLSWAMLAMADLTDALLREAVLNFAIFDRALLIRADLNDVTVEDADVTGVVFHELQGLPRPPSRLKLRRNGAEVILIGEEAANFFVLPAVVEVYLTRKLTEVEAGTLQFHLGEVHAGGAARDVYLVGHRHEREGSVLRFQGPTYEAVYAALPDLLAPFRTAAAIDWKVTFDSIPKEDRPDALAALVKAEARLVKGRWAIAERLAQSFEGFANARVVRLAEGRSKSVSITVATDDTMIEKVAWSLLPVTARNAAVVIHGPAELHGGQRMGDKINVNAEQVVGSAIGRDASVTAHDISVNVLKQAEASANQEWADVVKRALDALTAAKLPEADHAEAADTVGKIQAEAGKTDADPARPARIQRWLRTLSDLCKPASDLIAGAKVVAAALGLGV